MSKIRGKDTSIEVKVRKFLFNKGYCYRKNVTYLPGKPDIVLPRYKAVIFVHGCFWHRHPNCKDASTPKTRVDFWQKKFERNAANDIKKVQRLTDLGWNVIFAWECDINKYFDETMQRIINEIHSN